MSIFKPKLIYFNVKADPSAVTHLTRPTSFISGGFFLAFFWRSKDKGPGDEGKRCPSNLLYEINTATKLSVVFSVFRGGRPGKVVSCVLEFFWKGRSPYIQPFDGHFCFPTRRRKAENKKSKDRQQGKYHHPTRALGENYPHWVPNAPGYSRDPALMRYPFVLGPTLVA